MNTHPNPDIDIKNKFGYSDKSTLVVHNANGRCSKLLGFGEDARDIDLCWL